ncbi:hypothetical protein L6Q21_00325 [Sandaracinobacter sp. RS1-74]|uniref:hypothetical protein n=1 Tax=Sandaracinobacteroides sayramensis TaxID=2913411 RepID=UPI001EDC1F5A|nr:hypothetical protein [Sandaracinobacteroides sayramensis]MCG2839421.1 hypothetical protein [Sandaracinobacteroides sayramensis]
MTDRALARLMHGNWKRIEGEDGAQVTQRFADTLGLSFLRRFKRQEFQLEGLFAMPLACYPRHLLCEQEVTLFGKPAAAAFLFGEDGVTLLDGTSAPIHDLNEELSLSLDSAEAALDYARFFCNVVHGEEGRFQLVEAIEDLAPYNLGETQSLAASLTPSGIEADGGQWRVRGTVRYGRNLFSADFNLQHQGLIEMVDDQPLETELVCGPDSFEHFCRGLPICPEVD